MKMRNRITSIVLLIAVCCGGGRAAAQSNSDSAPLYTTAIEQTPDRHYLLTQKGRNRADLYTPDFQSIVRSWAFDETPTGVAVQGDDAYVTTFGTEGKLHILRWKTGEIEKVVPVGSGANAPTVGPDGTKLYVLNQFDNTVSEVDLKRGEVTGTVDVLREPKGAVADRSGKYLFVTNFLPAQAANLDTVAACVSVIELDGLKKIKDIQLANGSNAVRGICLSGDGKYVFVTHNLGRFQVPTSQLQQGWMNTSAMSVIDVATLTDRGAVLLDEPERGAAGIWGVRATPENIVISHSGTHEISVVDYPKFLQKFETVTDKAALAYDLKFMNGIRERIPLVGNGPRHFVLNDGLVTIPTYFSDTINLYALKEGTLRTVALVDGRTESRIDRGEKYFNDATHCFQNWQSCNGCHPGEARTDGMNWDLMNDGIGNSKNCKSMLFAHLTPPNMISGIRADAEAAVRAGYKLIQFTDLPEDYARCVDEYLKSLKPVPSPALVNGELSETAKRGREVFEKLECGECHSGPYFTDMNMHRIGDDIEFEQGWDTPTLREVWRTAPYLFDGRAATLEEVFSVHKHGVKKKLSKKELDELVEYVKSL